MPTPRANPDLLRQAQALRDEGRTIREIASTLGVSQGLISEKTTASPRRSSPSRAPETLEATLAAERARADRDKAETELKEAIREQSFRNFLAELFAAHLQPIPEQPLSRERPPSRRVRRHIRYPILHLSDWHYAEIVRKEAVIGLNEYDALVTARRAWRVVHSLLDCVDDWEASGKWRFPELTVLLNGDFLTGAIHGLERHTDAPNVIRSTIQCGSLLALVLADLAKRFERVRVVGVVGNHGRLPDDKKVPTKDATRSFDFMAYKLAQVALRDQSNITFEFPDAYGVLFDVAGRTCFLGHGHFLKQQLSIPALGVHRFMTALGSTLAAAMKKLEIVFLGHFHNSAKVEQGGVRTFINSSLIGTQEYGFHHSGKVNVPGQDAYMIDRQLGPIESYVFYGEGPGYTGTYRLPEWAA
jgi:hypothetical protein